MDVIAISTGSDKKLIANYDFRTITYTQFGTKDMAEVVFTKVGTIGTSGGITTSYFVIGADPYVYLTAIYANTTDTVTITLVGADSAGTDAVLGQYLIANTQLSSGTGYAGNVTCVPTTGIYKVKLISEDTPAASVDLYIGY